MHAAWQNMGLCLSNSRRVRYKELLWDHASVDMTFAPWLQITQLYEMIIVRHGLMLVGAPFSGKSVGLKLLAGALTDLNAEGKQGTLFEKVEMRVINPKSVTMGQLYGEVDRATQEWKVSIARGMESVL